MKKLSLFLFLSVILSIAGTARSFDSTYSAILQSKIEALKVSYGLKGISAAAYVPGQGLWLGASGISSETENATGFATGTPSEGNNKIPGDVVAG